MELLKLIIFPIFAALIGSFLITRGNKYYLEKKGQAGMQGKGAYLVLYPPIIYGIICYLVYIKEYDASNTLLLSAGVIACVGFVGAPILKGFLLNRLIKLGILANPEGKRKGIMLTGIIGVIPILALVMYLLVAFGIISK